MGTIYDQNEITAAHQTLPLGTKIMVTNLDNNRSLEMLVTDRGPFAKGRILDLSYASAQSLGAVGPGTIPVRIEVLDGPIPVSTIRASLDYTLQLGSFSQLQNAHEVRDRARQHGEVYVVPIQTKETTYYRVRLGTFTDRSSAEEKARQVAQAGFPVVIMEK